MDRKTYQEKAAAADRELKRKWTVRLLTPVALILVVGIATEKMHVVPPVVGRTLLFVLMAISGVVAFRYWNDHMDTSRRMGLVCPNCGKTLLVAGIDETNRCGKCKSVVLTD
jgi:ribosomal protein S27AE